jgi:hypothetical protein
MKITFPPKTLFPSRNFNDETPLQSDKIYLLLGFIYKTYFCAQKKGTLNININDR